MCVTIIIENKICTRQIFLSYSTALSFKKFSTSALMGHENLLNRFSHTFLLDKISHNCRSLYFIYSSIFKNFGISSLLMRSTSKSEGIFNFLFSSNILEILFVAVLSNLNSVKKLDVAINTSFL